MTRRPRIAILYHFLHPDDVISAQLFSLLAVGLAERGWDVEAIASNRSCHADVTYRPQTELWNDVILRRIWRPRWAQSTSKGRILNALWMITAWSTMVFRSRSRLPDVLFVGTDPVLSVLVAGVMKTIRPQVKVVHWAFDLYPEAALADGLLSADSQFLKLINMFLRYSYRSCDLVADLGPCMRDRLEYYGHDCQKMTLPPWALVEPSQAEKAEPELRRQLFGDAKLTLLYSGNFGRAHEFIEFVQLARQLRDTGIVLGFSVRGARVEELKAAVTRDDANIRFLPFASEAELGRHLATGDIHLVSLRQNWTGIVVPSKFFGSLASGRPVLFAGEAKASISRWIEDYQVGWRVSSDNIQEVAGKLTRLSENRDALAPLQHHCHAVYQQHFSRRHVVECFDQEMRKLLKEVKGG